MLDTPHTWTLLLSDALYSKDSKGKLRVSYNSLSHNALNSTCSIQRTTGIKGGSLIDQPIKTITKGKAKRTLEEQGVLEYNAIIKKQKDKGYQSLEDLGLSDKASTDEILATLGNVKTSAGGLVKPMLAKDMPVEDRKKVIDSQPYWLRSTKLDGIRTTAALVGEELVFGSRGGMTFQGAVEHFKTHPELIALAKKYNSQIDGELYKHGVHLETISGVCRMKDYTPDRHDWLEFHIFDLANTTMTAQERADIVNELEFEDPRIKIVKHEAIKDYVTIMDKHAEDLKNGFEGSILRNPKAYYGYGKRNKDMVKLKDFQDAEFKVVGYKEGLRPTTDMVFVLELEDGRTFEAKPFGDDTIKQKYIDSFESLKGEMGTVKFFQYSAEGVPILTSFKCFRPVVQDKVMF